MGRTLRKPHKRAKDIRGNSYDRRARRAYLIERYGVARKLDGKKTRIRCFHCARLMFSEKNTWDCDRYPICGHVGGRYTRDNIVPSCIPCNRISCTPTYCRRQNVRN